MKFAILKNGSDANHEYWIKSCETYNVQYKLIDFYLADWLDKILSEDYSCYLLCPPGIESINKVMYDERVRILSQELKKWVYPSYEELLLHENKRYLSYWLKSNSLPHPQTFVFYDKNEALDFTKNSALPIVGKFNIGASGKGVKIFRERKQLEEYVKKAFSKGIRQEWGPNTKMKNYRERIKNVIRDPTLIIKRIVVYRKLFNEIQKDFLIFQEFVPHNYEWRVVKIGSSYFGHQKIKQGDKASGSKGITYTLPPEDLLNFVKNLCDRFGFNSMAVDCFEDGKGGYLINEMQCVFGHVQEFICEKDKKPGRLKYSKDQWVFEEGLFNANKSFNLRLEDVMASIKQISG